MAARRGPASLTKDQWAEKYERERALVAELRAENRKISQALDAVLKVRSQLRDDAADSVSEEIDALDAQLDQYREHGTPEDIADDHAAMLRALGMDEYEWGKVRWRY